MVAQLYSQGHEHIHKGTKSENGSQDAQLLPLIRFLGLLSEHTDGSK